MKKFENEKFKLYFIINVILVIILSLILSLIVNFVFLNSKRSVEKDVISSLAEIEKKESINLISGLDYESEDDINQLIKTIKSKDYIIDKSFSWSAFNQGFYIFIFSSILFIALILENFYYFRWQRNDFFKYLDTYIQSLIEEKYDVNLPDDREDVFSKINLRFNKLGMYLRKKHYKSEENINQMRSSLADISHQIKTPLTSISINNEIILDGSNITKEQRKFLQISQVQIKRLKWLTNSLLKMSKLEANAVKFKKRDIFAWELVAGFEDILKGQLEKSQLKITRRGKLDTILSVDFDWTREALLNIVKNATEHAYSNTEIEVVFLDNPVCKGIEIYNQGEPIDLNEISKIFDRFYKSKTNNNPESIGIGLNLSKNIIESQGGIISVTNEIGKIKFAVLFLKI